MIIDIHTHVGRWDTKRLDFDEDRLLAAMDKFNIDRAVLLPVVSPESFFEVVPSRDVAAIARRHPDRFIPFCNLDPRNNGNKADTDFSWILEEYKGLGCRGVGELTANLHIDDPRYKNLFAQCGKAGLPVLFHLADRIGGVYGPADDLGLPRLEALLNEFPPTVFIGHAMSFWSEIDGNLKEEERSKYPPGKIEKPGRLVELLRKYPNLYADLSAGSGFNAISRDPEFGWWFLNEFQDKLLFGTDLCHVDQDAPIAPYFQQLKAEKRITPAACEKITAQNACRILGLSA
ncbi:MAG: amidohydrolase family protein [Verrucomicrobia bacterium]|nr:amidohydrolase family protein [Verrucomicrobiota bacterium]MBU4291082.1 amidohydrolase family protein [Verrucomicrobiota bacterium]MBU4429368.1 amidohydrolase family protein [Verrucomicrobiota bacterium]MBU4498119.1 amidohydrolase family protein [Verrucomicrobiota bacterium]MCG2680099.1 amidohydrolase family protein [Kiritimatiellia bacterium]